MHERFNDEARQAMKLAEQEAGRLNHHSIASEHLFMALLAEDNSAVKILTNLDCDTGRLRLGLQRIAQPGHSSAPPPSELPPSSELQEAIAHAVREADRLDRRHVGAEFLLLGLVSASVGVVAEFVDLFGLRAEAIRHRIITLPLDDTPRARSKTPALDSFSRDLTEMARQGKLDPVVGRTRELERVIQVLCRRSMNNPALVGEAGVGKTSIIEGLAQRIVDEDVPELMRGKRIHLMDLAMMVAGTKYRGQFEERIKAVLNEVRRARNVLLVFEDLHTVIGAGSFDGSIDAGDVLKPALTRGEIQCIGTTTLDNYRKHVEQDGALQRRFQQVRVMPPSMEETLKILEGLRDRYEAHHRVQIVNKALEVAIELSNVFLPDSSFPQKAINLIDEAGSQVRLTGMVIPPSIREVGQEIEKLNQEKDAAVADQDFEKASALRDVADKLKKRKQSMIKEWREKSKEVDGVVDEETVIEALSRQTGIAPEVIRARDTSSFSPRPHGQPTLPAFERLQCESILHGQDITIVPGFGFVLIPHNDRALGIYEAAIRPAMEDNGLEVKIAGDIYEPGSILNQVWGCIRSAEVIVADVSEQNPNVIYELGLCFGLRRFPILLVRDPGSLPFNLRALRYIKYEDSVAGARTLREDLSATIREFLAATRGSRQGG